MGDDRRSLEEKEALVGGGGGDPPATGLFDEMFVVLRRLKSQQREPEAVLAAALSVAAAAVAAEFREHRDHPAEELDRRIVAKTCDDQRHAGLGEIGESRDGGDADDDLPLAIGRRDDDPLGGDRGEGGGLDPVARLPGDVALMVGVGARRDGADDELPAPFATDDVQRATSRFAGGNLDPGAGGRVGRSLGGGERADRHSGSENCSERPRQQAAPRAQSAGTPEALPADDRQHGHIHGSLHGDKSPHKILNIIPQTVTSRKDKAEKVCRIGCKVFFNNRLRSFLGGR